MVSICDGEVILRDFIQSDIEKRICWETEQTEWQLWDAPWEYEGLTDAQKQKDLNTYIEKMQAWPPIFEAMPDTKTRVSFQICTKANEYIGWVNSYRIDDEYNYSSDGVKRAIGIDIPETAQRGKGYAFRALCLFIDYLRDHGESDIYIQTWSGNIRMAALAKKLGFEECSRKKDIRLARGKTYDGLTFRLNASRYATAKQER